MLSLPPPIPGALTSPLPPPSSTLRPHRPRGVNEQPGIPHKGNCLIPPPFARNKTLLCPKTVHMLRERGGKKVDDFRNRESRDEAELFGKAAASS